MPITAPTPPAWAAKVDELLAVKGQTRQWLAGAIGVSAGQLTRLLAGDRPALPAVVLHIAAALEIPADWLAGKGPS